ncbi:PREDICTED: uncharacterized protein LOC105555746 [Vollenhovia emeryi]|uniref:uncharacterized protein LOC105555746 n=1 Tax=Vollenhovia emeryi TaxID=411798 RepID=UPI0005F4B638|nr:PREDICTED: uncharacterized protein LOC105555746 [Vollenhovia emeryi]
MANENASASKLAYRKRAAKASMTRLETFVNSIEPLSVDVEEVKLRVEKLDEVYATFSEIQIDLAANGDTASEADQDEENEEIENKYFRLKAAMKRLMKDGSVTTDEGMLERTTIAADETGINDNEGLRVPAVNANINEALRGPAVNANINEALRVPAFNANIRLPRIELPKFSGAYEEWHSFFDVFGSLIHSNRELNDTQRFHYLKSSLKGDAAEVVSSLEMTGDNYRDAWARLKERYDNKRLIQNHIKAIFDLPVVKREDGAAIRQVLDGVLKHTRALRALERPIEYWGDLLIHVISGKLDIRTIKEWENSIESTRVPAFDELVEFLKKRCQTLEAVAKIGKGSKVDSSAQSGNASRIKGCNVAATKLQCSCCQGNHSIYACKEFKGLSVDERVRHIKSKGLCLNCLKSKHMVKDCASGGCKTCNKRHNSLLHKEGAKEESTAESKGGKTTIESESERAGSAACGHACSAYQGSQMLLSTVMVKVKHKEGHFVQIKALLDSGAESNFVTESLARRLDLELRSANIEITGINQQVSRALTMTEVCVRSRFDSYDFKLQCIILPTITRKVPYIRFDKRSFGIPNNIRLADPQFNIPSEIDLVIGTERFWDLMCAGQIKMGRGKPTLQKTMLGWLVVDKMLPTRHECKQYANCNLSSTRDLDEALRLFWKLDNVPERSECSEEEAACEEFFKDTYGRNEQGRFVVKLPIKEGVLEKSGESRDIARRRFLSLERRLNKDAELKNEYIQFMRDYERLGHMKEIHDAEDKLRIFLPHQAVVRNDKSSTRVRVVFDASSKERRNVS